MPDGIAMSCLMLVGDWGAATAEIQRLCTGAMIFCFSIAATFRVNA